MTAKGKSSKEMLRVIAAFLRELHKAGLLVITNEQKFISAELEQQKLVIRLEDAKSGSNNR